MKPERPRPSRASLSTRAAHRSTLRTDSTRAWYPSTPPAPPMAPGPRTGLSSSSLHVATMPSTMRLGRRGWRAVTTARTSALGSGDTATRHHEFTKLANGPVMASAPAADETGAATASLSSSPSPSEWGDDDGAGGAATLRVVRVPNSRKPSAAGMAGLLGSSSRRDSMRGTKDDSTSNGAESMSSTTIHRPCSTAWGGSSQPHPAGSMSESGGRRVAHAATRRWRGYLRQRPSLPLELAGHVGAHIGAQQALAVHAVVQVELDHVRVARAQGKLANERRLSRASRPLQHHRQRLYNHRTPHVSPRPAPCYTSLAQPATHRQVAQR